MFKIPVLTTFKLTHIDFYSTTTASQVLVQREYQCYYNVTTKSSPTDTRKI